jgi:nicotinamide riboside kinase
MSGGDRAHRTSTAGTNGRGAHPTRYAALVRWRRPGKIAFIGSHGIRKTTAAHAFATTIQRAGRSVEYGREVIRDNPLGINEAATPESQLWVLVSQIRQELELIRRAEVLVLDRGVMDNFAYYLRASGGADPFSVEPLVRSWSSTYDLVVRLIPDLALRPDGVRSMNDAFRDAIEAILDDRLPDYVAPDRTIAIPASSVVESLDWWPVAERLAAIVGEPLLAPGVTPPRRRGPRRDGPGRGSGGPGASGQRGGGPAAGGSGQLALELPPEPRAEP